jgi:glycosyltransferase involved in cell wall biosynthesis
MNTKMIELAIVTPVYNEEQVIPHFYERMVRVMDALDASGTVTTRLVYVLDRSRDASLSLLSDIASRDSRVTVIALSSRFGHQMSLLAGIDHVKDSDAVVMLDSDLQHPPELIEVLLSHFYQGASVVYTVRKDTENINPLRKWAGNIFYRTLSYISSIPIHPNAADFRLISRSVARTLCEDFRERRMFLRGLFTWIGFEQVAVEFVADQRAAGTSKYSFSRMLQLATAGILSFSTKPLHVGIFIGISFSALSLLMVIFTIINYFVDKSIPSGWTTVVILLLLFGGIQLIIMGIMGAYIGSIYEEIKSRPRYIIEKVIGK